MKKIKESIIIDRPPEEVFEFFDNRSNDRLWMESVEESEWLEPDESTRIGRRGRMVMQAMGNREFIDRVTEYEPGRKVAHRSESDSMIINTACIAEPADKGGCRVTVTYEPERLPGGILGRLTAPITYWIVRRNFRSDLARLKNILETNEHLENKEID